MSKITVDGKTIEAKAGQTIIQACDDAGIEIPRYCYHPGLSIAGNCRICLVQVEKMPKLTIACNTRAADGMVVHTKNNTVEANRKAVLEFLLINHPLDCPVCDQAGECRLQDYYMKYGQYNSTFKEDKVKKHKAQPIGPNVMLDSERCILCSLCVRFCDEITKTHELGIKNRGDREELVLGAGKTLDNNYAGNTVDICPVGALTDRDFRFQTRVWYLSSTPSVCPGCSMGCNIEIHTNRSRPYKAGGKRVARLKPRANPEVNQWWMCDTGRHGYGDIDSETRIQRAYEQTRDRSQPVDMDVVIHAAAERFAKAAQSGKAGVLLSHSLTTEELYLADKIFSKHLGLKKVLTYPLNRPAEADGFLLQEDRNPNTAAVRLLGLKTLPSAIELENELLKDNLSALYIMGHDLEYLLGSHAPALLEKIDLVIFQGTHDHSTSKRAHLVLPGAAYAEKDGTFINKQKRIQIIREAVRPTGEARPDWEILLGLGTRLKLELNHLRTPAEIFAEMASRIDALRGLSYETIAGGGQVIKEGRLVSP